jgi:hypothetical protein
MREPAAAPNVPRSMPIADGRDRTEAKLQRCRSIASMLIEIAGGRWQAGEDRRARAPRTRR